MPFFFFFLYFLMHRLSGAVSHASATGIENHGLLLVPTIWCLYHVPAELRQNVVQNILAS